MNPNDYLLVLRRRWAVVASITVVAILAGWVTLAVRTSPGHKSAAVYQATAVLLPSSTSTMPPGVSVYGLSTMAALVTIDPILSQAAHQLGFTGDPSSLAGMVTANADPHSGLLSITATSTDRSQASAIADTFADQLIEFIKAQQRAELGSQVQAIQTEIAKDNEQLANLARQGQTGTINYSQLVSDRDALVARRDTLISTTPNAGLAQIQQATASRVQGSSSAVPTGSALLLIAALLGLLGGLGVALVLERMDTRIRTKEMAEKGFSLPVLAEIPVIPRQQRDEIVAAAYPRSPAAEAFRLLGAELMRGSIDNGDGKSRARGPLSAILVTSPGPSEGKTTVVANLAIAIAETGRRVLVVSCDFRRPGLHHLFQVPNDRGLVDGLRSTNGKSILASCALDTQHLGIRIVPSGPVPENPTELLSSENMQRFLGEAWRGADTILLDAPPLLSVGDAAYLVREVEAVLLVARAGKTRVELAERATGILHRLGAPMVGVALTGASETPRPRGYRSYFEEDLSPKKTTTRINLLIRRNMFSGETL